jgi:hypothetical protein
MLKNAEQSLLRRRLRIGAACLQHLAEPRPEVDPPQPLSCLCFDHAHPGTALMWAMLCSTLEHRKLQDTWQER